MSDHIRKFETWEDCMAKATGVCDLVDTNRASRQPNAKEFRGTEDWAECVDLLRSGWGEGRSKAKDISDKISAVLAQKILRPEPRFSESGDEVEVGRFLVGEPEHFIEYQMAEAKSCGRIVSVGYNVVAPASIDKQILINRGAAVFALVDALEQADYRCELAVACAMGRSDYHWEFTATIKQPDQPFEVDRAAFIFMHPSMLRRFVFSLEECEEPEVRRKLNAEGYFGSYGRPADTKTLTGMDFVFEGLAGGDVSRWATVESCTTEILRLCKQSGLIELTE